MYVFRLVKVLVGARFRGRLGALDQSTLRFLVWPNDLDVNLHMNNGRFLTLMDLGRFDLLARTGLLRAAVRNRWRPIVGSAFIRFRRSLRPFQRYDLKSRILAWDDKWAYIEQRFERDGTLLAAGLVQGLLRGPDGNVPTQTLMAAIGHEAASPPVPDWASNPMNFDSRNA